MKNLITILLSIAILSYTIIAQEVNSSKQDSQTDSESLAKANEILSQARKAVKKGNESLKIDGFSITYAVTRQIKTLNNEIKSTTAQDDTGERQLNALLPDKFKFSETMGDASRSAVYNYVLNGDQVENEMYGMSNGQRIEFQIKGQNPSADQKQQLLLRIKKINAFLLFPIILASPNYTPLDFHYVGKAEANGEKADVIEVILHDNSNFRIFFDEKSHLLKMTISNFKNQNLSLAETRFFSDYTEVNGIMVANKINIETKQSSKLFNSELFEEMTLKSIKFNPTFKPNLFDVKDK